MKPLLIALLVVGVGGTSVASYQAYRAATDARTEIARQDEQVGRLQEQIEELRDALAARSTADDQGDDRGMVRVAVDAVTETEPVAVSTAAGDTDVDTDVAMAMDLEEDPEIERLAAVVKSRLVEDTKADLTSRDVLKAALKEIQDEEEEERQSRRNERRKERLLERVRGYTERLHLQPQQEEEMVTIFTESSEARFAIFRQAREGSVPRDEVRELMQENRDAADLEIQRVLTSDQYTEYQLIRTEEQASGDGDWGRRGRRGGGGSSTTPATGNTQNNSRGL